MTPEQVGPLPSAPQRSAKHADARAALDERLHAAFDALVQDYQFYATVHYGSRLVSYLILADLVRAGWRPSAPSEFPPLTEGEKCETNELGRVTAPPQEPKRE